jgi:hypothetical protein
VQPWYNSATQAASAVALAARAGYLRNPDTFQKAKIVFSYLIPDSGTLSSRLPDGSVWFWEFGQENYSMKGMIQTLLSLHEYHRIVGDPRRRAYYEWLKSLQKKCGMQDKGCAGRSVS